MSWKTVGIIFMVLLIIETIGFIWLLNLGLDVEQKRNDCIYNVCAEYDVFSYEDLTEICTCYDTTGEIAIERYVGRSGNLLGATEVNV
jgi:hypothetical protein